MKFQSIMLGGAAMLLAFIAPPDANAFKVDTHVWIAQEIIDDIQDGKLSINGYEVPVNSLTKRIILENQDVFRAGSIGPDAAPDVLIGQMLIHPGKEGGGVKNTNEWIRYFEDISGNNEERAFAKGMWIHAAADVISHTYVNMYSGDVFELGAHLARNHPDLEPDRRHFLLESYIGKYTPNLSNNRTYYDSVRLPKKVSLPYLNCGMLQNGEYDEVCLMRKMKIEADRSNLGINKDNFIMRNFFYDPDLIRLNVSQGKSASSGYPQAFNYYNASGAHAKAIYHLRYKVEQLIQSEKLKELDEYVARTLVYNWTGVDIQDADLLVDLAQDVQGLSYKSTREVNRIRQQLEDILEKTNLKSNELTQSVAREVDRNLQKVHSLHIGILDLETKILTKQNEISTKVCKWFTPKFICNLISKVKKELINLRSSVAGKISEFALDKNNLSHSIRNLHELVQDVNTVRRSVNDVTWDLALVLQMDANPIRALLINWATGIDKAMLDYQYVGLEMMKSSMHPSQNALDPLKKWAITDCSLVKIAGLGDKLGSSSCRLFRSVRDLEEELGFLADVVTSISPLSLVIEREIQKIVDSEIKQLKNEFARYLTVENFDKIEPELAAFVNLLHSKNINDTTLNYEFNQANSSNHNGYLSIPDAAQRIKKEMGLTSSGCYGKSQCFNKNTYPVVKNAVTLAKMALLNHAELEVLANKIGISKYAFISSASQKNLLDSTIFSIDGSHQWHDGKPSYPRTNNFTIHVWDYSHNFGNGELFGDSGEKKIVYDNLFIGPMEKGLFTPNNLGGFSQLLSSQYLDHYRTCVGVAFITGVNDRRCQNMSNPDPVSGGNGGGTPPGGGGNIPPIDDECMRPNSQYQCR